MPEILVATCLALVIIAAIWLVYTPAWWVPGVALMWAAVVYLGWPRDPYADAVPVGGFQALGQMMISGGLASIGLVTVIAGVIARRSAALALEARLSGPRLGSQRLSDPRLGSAGLTRSSRGRTTDDDVGRNRPTSSLRA